MKPRIGFVLEQALGHVAYGKSLREALERRSDFEAVWLEVPSDAEGLGRVPVLGHFLRANLRARFAIARAGRQASLDALFVHTEAISVLSGDYLSKIPSLLSFDATPKNFDQLGSWYGHRVGGASYESAKTAIHRSVIRRARAITTWSEWAKRSVVEDYGVAPGSVTVLHPGTSLDRFRRARSDGTSRPVRLLFVGADFERKGGDLLLRVYREHLSSLCELHLVTTANIAPQPSVFVHRGLEPQSPELLRIYAEADVFVMPTRADCFGVVFAEAMAASLPIVTTRVAAIPEVVRDGETGFVIEVDDHEALRRRLELLVCDADLRETMGRRARSVGEERFDMNKHAERLVDLLFGIMGRKSG